MLLIVYDSSANHICAAFICSGLPMKLIRKCFLSVIQRSNLERVIRRDENSKTSGGLGHQEMLLEYELQCFLQSNSMKRTPQSYINE